LDEPKTEVMYHQRALLVEDIHFSAEASKSVLQSLGFEVVVVDSGNAAIERVSMDRFDIVFLDINLPDQSRNGSRCGDFGSRRPAFCN